MYATRRTARSWSISRLVAGAATVAVTAALVTVTSAPGAQAAGQPTDFAFTSFAYGTKVKATAGGFARAAPRRAGSGARARPGRYAPTRCSASTHRTTTRWSSSARSPATAAPSRPRSRASPAARRARRRWPASSSAFRTRGSPSPVLTINGLTTTATAWATTDGRSTRPRQLLAARPQPGRAAHGYAARRAAGPASTWSTARWRRLSARSSPCCSRTAGPSRSRGSARSSWATRTPASGRDRPSPWPSRCA